MNVPDKVLIVGLGTTGISLAKYLAELGCKVTITDQKDEKELAPSLSLIGDIPYSGRFGGHSRDDFFSHPLIIVSPGVDTAMPYLEEARRSGTEVIGEIEFASRFIEEPMIGITGTNGKTTTTSLLGEIFAKAYGDVFVGGNIGNPLVNYLLQGKKSPFLILEISSFQLETIETFKAKTAVLLNITEDHLDRYSSFVDYRAAKYRIFENQAETENALLNVNLVPCKKIKAKKYFFSTTQIVGEGAYLINNTIHVRLHGKETLYDRGLSGLPGIHNSENILAALLVSHLHGVEQDIIKEALLSFRGLPHRVELIREFAGVRFYNDSKATNVDATKRALEGMEGNVVLIAGGKDKGGSYQAIRNFKEKVRAVVLIGEARERILQELNGQFTFFNEETLEDAVNRAAKVAKKGDAVLFSPMCSSFDMFTDYKERGNRFRRLVESL